MLLFWLHLPKPKYQTLIFLERNDQTLIDDSSIIPSYPNSYFTCCIQDDTEFNTASPADYFICCIQDASSYNKVSPAGNIKFCSQDMSIL